MNNGRICISICAKTVAEMREQISRAEPLADIIELRFDCLEPDELRPRDLAFDSTKQILCTFRPQREGGYASDDKKKRLDLWSDLASNPHFENTLFDLESDIISEVDVAPDRKIASFHDFSGVPNHLSETFDRLGEGSIVIKKIAVQTDDCADAISLWKFLRGKCEVIPIAMGEAGKWTRILGPAYGSFLTYASLDAGRETAPGQISARDMLDLYRVKKLNKDTFVYGIIGDPVAQSLSPHMHNPAFAKRGMNAVFIPFSVKDLDTFVNRMLRSATSEVEFKFGGLSVTMPHKQTIMKCLDKLDETARSIGAVNTIKVENDKLVGYNTDAIGFITPLRREYGDLQGSRVAVVGAGGAARACVYALKNAEAKVTLFARDPDRARPLADAFDVDLEPLPKTAFTNFDILVNATPYGMGDLADDTIATAEQLSGVKFVYDLVTKPYDTPLVREAKLAGSATMGGLEMLTAQGVEQFRIWTGTDASETEMKANILNRLSQ